jgi:signal transduction histidine kinase
VIAAVQLNSVTATGPSQHPLGTLTYTFGTVMSLPVLFRRRWPRGALIACSVGLFAFYSLARRDISPVPLLCLPLYDATAAGFLALAIIIPAFYMVVGLFVVGASTRQSMLVLASEFLPSVVVLLLAVLLGDTVRSRRAIAAQTADRLRLAAAQREREAASRVAEERLRIARELHDTVAHSMATITVQAASALHVLGPGGDIQEDSGPGGPGARASRPGAGRGSAATGQAAPGASAGAVPDAVREALAAIRDTSKGALADIRITLGELRGEEGELESAESRTAGLARLDALSGAVRAAGAPVSVIIEGDPVELPPAVDHSAYRILQECLTNVLRHAGPQASADVLLRYQPGGLVIEVTDDGPAAEPAAVPGGHGLTGMTERAEALGGELTAGPRPGGGFRVTARLPLPATEAAGRPETGSAAQLASQPADPPGNQPTDPPGNQPTLPPGHQPVGPPGNQPAGLARQASHGQPGPAGSGEADQRAEAS